MFDAKYKPVYLTKEVCDRINQFWEWFGLQHTELEKLIKEQNKKALNSLERALCEVFKDYKKTIPFALGYSDNKFKLFIYFGHNSYLLTVGDELYNMMPKYLKKDWIVFIEK